MNTEPVPENILRLERPHPALWTYYIISSIFTGPGIIVTLPYLYFRDHTLRYRFDAEGIHMKVGILFRREVNLTYARIQDIHLRSGILQRWLGLANVQIQTASGSGGPELVIEGFKEYEAVRDFLYTRMRGYQTHGVTTGHGAESSPTTRSVHESSAPGAPPPIGIDTISLLYGIRDELKQTRELLEARSSSAVPPRPSPPDTSSSHV